MRYRSYSTFCLVVILFYLLRPSLPYFEYVIDRDHIEKNHCIQKDSPENSCHGKCYLHDQINKQSGKTDSGPDRDDKLIQDNKMDDHLKVSAAIPEVNENGTVSTEGYAVAGTVSFVSYVFVPPKS